MNPAFLADIDLKEFIVGSIGINNWVFFGLSVIAVLLFSMFHGSSRPNSNLIPNLNLLISTALVLKWYSFLSIDPRYNQSATFGEMALNLPLLYLETLLMSQESLRFWFLLTIFNGLHTISIWAFTISFSGFEWLWLVFAIIFYVGILSVLGDKVLCVMKRKPGTVISIYNLFLTAVILFQVTLDSLGILLDKFCTLQNDQVFLVCFLSFDGYYGHAFANWSWFRLLLL